MGHRVILPAAEKRSKLSLYTALSQLVISNPEKLTIPLDSPDIPWYSMEEVAPVLQTRYKGEKILVLFNTQSGESYTPQKCANELRNYFEKNGRDRFTICAVTSTPDSTVGKFAREFGTLIELKGEDKSTDINPPSMETTNLRETGMGDMFELASASLFQNVVQLLHLDQKPESFRDFVRHEFEITGKIVDEASNSEFYTKAVNDLVERHWVMKAPGKGPGDYVADAALKMLENVKKAISGGSDQVYSSNAPAPRAGDMQLTVSFSGGFHTLPTCLEFKGYKGKQFSVIGQKDSVLAENSDVFFLIEEDVKPNDPRQFYVRALHTLSPLPILVVEKSKEKFGPNVTRDLLNYYRTRVPQV
ncbi:MAG: hypothetical protein J4452_01910 [Candidatus Aenigmarchaeota archaeon]|nr:hypothetical protein [Candidatus Aenigmarchaeota archaeon]